MEQTFFKLKINIPNLDSYMGNNVDPCTFTYLSELIVNHKEEKVSIKIFYPEREYLAYKLKAFNHNRENNLLKQFEVVETLSPDELGGIDFTGFKSYGITDGSNDLVKFKSDGPEFKFTVVSVTGVRIKFKDLADGPSQFYLNSVGFLLVEMNYKYSSKLPWEDKAPQTNYSLKGKTQSKAEKFDAMFEDEE